MLARASFSWLAFVCFVSIASSTLSVAEEVDLEEALGKINGRFAEPGSEQAKRWQQTLAADFKARLQAACLRESAAYNELKTKADWEKFRDPRITALKKSLGPFPEVPTDLKVRVTGEKTHDGFIRQNIVYESRPGLIVTANLYRPAKSNAQKGASMPGILISHSHHNPKWESELQDMGSIWAKQGCVVLVPDHLGHGERRQHPFVNAMSFAGSFRPSRQDYYFRHNVALQLHLAGESLMGWMVWDLMRGVEVLLAQKEVDPQKICLFGAVAGGGDPAGVTGALDPRIAVVGPFNFGGMQPDYSTPPYTDRDFYWFSDPYWETTRCLRLGARDGFAHWAIVSSIAPRKLLYCHEFSWDAMRDPAWSRIQKVYELEGVPAHLALAHGRGTLKGQPPESSHCNNIGAVHRQMMYPPLEKWLGLPIPQSDANKNRELTADLTCLSEEAKTHPMRPAREIALEMAVARSDKAHDNPKTKSGAIGMLRREWSAILGGVEPAAMPREVDGEEAKSGGLHTTRVVLEVAPRIELPLILLKAEKGEAKRPCVVAISQQGKEGFLRNRSKVIAALLKEGIAVCLADLRGTGESSSGGRDWRGSATTWSQGEQMFGGTSIGAQLRDLRSVLQYLRSHPDIASDRLAVWGDSFSKVNSDDINVAVPLDAEQPNFGEPGGGVLALLVGLYDDSLKGVATRGALVSYKSVLKSPFVHVPVDAMVPGAIPAGDLELVAISLAPRPLRIESPIDGQNRYLTDAADDALARIQASHKGIADSHLEIKLGPPQDDSLAAWFLKVLEKK